MAMVAQMASVERWGEDGSERKGETALDRVSFSFFYNVLGFHPDR